jgi:hypothetical protein
MASFLMHLYVGKKFIEKHGNIPDLPQFYLGCVIPDSVNTDGFAASKETRWAAHLRSGNLKEWYDNNIQFYRSNIGNSDHALLLGFVIHNITDAAYDEFFNAVIKEELRKINKPPILKSGLDKDDFYRFEYDQRKEPWWTNDVLPALKKAIPAKINGINENQADRYIQYRTDDKNFTFPEGNPIMITMEMMNELSDIVTGIVDDFINA